MNAGREEKIGNSTKGWRDDAFRRNEEECR